ncbi:MAG: response regulator [Candidatus Omnitrophica bacterium]|nr:response regulator [Candidatus Omnitrophota bacterium]
MQKTVLLVDDEDEVRNILQRAIERRGVKVFSAANGEDGVKLYKEHNPLCVFLDVKLPGIQGPEVLRQIKEFDSQAKVYFITGMSGNLSELKEQEEKLGACGHLSKPILIEDVLKILETI